MTAMSKLRASRIVFMCMNYSEYDSSVVSPPVLDEDGRKHWQVSYTSEDKYHVVEWNGLWHVCRIDAFVLCSDDLPVRKDVTLL